MNGQNARLFVANWKLWNNFGANRSQMWFENYHVQRLQGQNNCSAALLKMAFYQNSECDLTHKRSHSVSCQSECMKILCHSIRRCRGSMCEHFILFFSSSYPCSIPICMDGLCHCVLYVCDRFDVDACGWPKLMLALIYLFQSHHSLPPLQIVLGNMSTEKRQHRIHIHT